MSQFNWIPVSDIYIIVQSKSNDMAVIITGSLRFGMILGALMQTVVPAQIRWKHICLRHPRWKASKIRFTQGTAPFTIRFISAAFL